MPTEAVEKPVVEESKADDSGSGSDTDSEDSMPDLEDQDVAQQSRVRIRPRDYETIFMLS